MICVNVMTRGGGDSHIKGRGCSSYLYGKNAIFNPYHSGLSEPTLESRPSLWAIFLRLFNTAASFVSLNVRLVVREGFIIEIVIGRVQLLLEFFYSFSFVVDSSGVFSCFYSL